MQFLFWIYTRYRISYIGLFVLLLALRSFISAPNRFLCDGWWCLHAPFPCSAVLVSTWFSTLQNTELVEDLLTKYCPDVMEHLKGVNLELIVLTPR